MSPIVLLLSVTAVTIAAGAASAFRCRARSAKLAALANTWGIRFTLEDRLGLAPRVASGFPIAGVADVLVRDLMYRQEEQGFRYLFTVEYTLGILRTKRRRTGAGMVVEGGAGEAFSAVTLAPGQLPLLEQYQWLWKQCPASPPRGVSATQTAGLEG